MKVKLIFDLDKDTDDEYRTIKGELDDAMNGAKYRRMVDCIQSELHSIFRSANKYDTVPFIEGELSDEQYEFMEKFSDYYYKNIYKEIDDE